MNAARVSRASAVASRFIWDSFRLLRSKVRPRGGGQLQGIEEEPKRLTRQGAGGGSRRERELEVGKLREFPGQSKEFVQSGRGQYASGLSPPGVPGTLPTPCSRHWPPGTERNRAPAPPAAGAGPRARRSAPPRAIRGPARAGAAAPRSRAGDARAHRTAP